MASRSAATWADVYGVCEVVLGHAQPNNHDRITAAAEVAAEGKAKGEAMSLYKHMSKLADARDDESRPLAERVIAAEVMETAARLIYERAQAKAKELREMQVQAKQAAPDSVQTTNVLADRMPYVWRCVGDQEAKQ